MISKDNAQHDVWGRSCDGWHLLNSCPPSHGDRVAAPSE